MKTIFEYDSFRTYLQDYCAYRKSKESSFSMRSFENRLNVSNGYLTRIIKGEKSCSPDLITRFVQCLKLRKREATYFDLLVRYEQAKKETARQYLYERLLHSRPSRVPSIDKGQYELFQESHHVKLHALVSVLKIKANNSYQHIGQMLSPVISTSKVKASFDLLLKLGLIAIKDGYLTVTDRNLSTGKNPRDLTLRRFLTNSLEEAMHALNAGDESEREVSIMTLSLSEKSYSTILEKMAELRKEIHTIVQNDNDTDQVYQMGMFTIPVSQKIEEKNER